MEELSEMIRRLHEAANGDTERRGAPRVARQGVLSIHLSSPESTKTVQFRDCSATGIGFCSTSSLTLGTLFEVIVKHPARGDLVFRYEVVRCQKTSNQQYIIGAKLLR